MHPRLAAERRQFDPLDDLPLPRFQPDQRRATIPNREPFDPPPRQVNSQALPYPAYLDFLGRQPARLLGQGCPGRPIPA
jgi:hypothetical protein